jgi:DNA-directed RNA polymerase subunit RPC12/RpoP
MKKLFSVVLLVTMLSVLSATLVFAQSTSQLQLSLRRDFGYSLGGDIQGTFTISINNAPDNLSRVIFYIDSTSMGEVTQPPFRLQFNTGSYALGAHTLSAVGYTTDGAELTSNTIQAQFVPASASTQAITRFVLPILGVVVIIIAITVVVPLITSKGKLKDLPLGAPRNYGIGGGVICPKCGRPFPLRLWWINIGLSKIDRCPYCGKWSLVRRASPDELRKAEEAELSQAQSGTTPAGESEEEKLKRDLDDSRYQNQ